MTVPELAQSPKEGANGVQGERSAVRLRAPVEALGITGRDVVNKISDLRLKFETKNLGILCKLC